MDWRTIADTAALVIRDESQSRSQNPVSVPVPERFRPRPLH